MLFEVDGLPSWYRSMRFRGIDGELERWVASCGRILLFVRGVGSGYVSYFWEVNY